MVLEVKSKAEFQEQLKNAGTKLVVVDFYATWCGPCKHIAPKIAELATNTPDVVFLKVDVDEVEELASEYNISCMPTFLFLKNGEKVEEFSGANEEKIKDLVEKLK
jgi:thioredoxin 1